MTLQSTLGYLRREHGRVQTRFSYCIYPLNYDPRFHQYIEQPTLQQAADYAKMLGPGAIIIRNVEKRYEDGSSFYYSDLEWEVV